MRNWLLASLLLVTFGCIKSKKPQPLPLVQSRAIPTAPATAVASGTGSGTAQATVMLPEVTASALASGEYTGMATRFDLPSGAPRGCGAPLEALTTQDIAALNIQDTPNDYVTTLQRPVAADRLGQLGAFANGTNCGRWVRVTLGDVCKGVNDGAGGAGFCRLVAGSTANTATWVADSTNGATLDLLVADSCQDANAWCRDDRYHLGLTSAALGHFTKNGTQVPTLDGATWNNRQISWKYIAAPNYQGDIQLGLRQDATANWLPVIISNLPNGLHGVEREVGGSWVKATMLSDNGLVYQLPAGAAPYRIRLYDAAGTLLNNGRIYEFDFPSTCSPACTDTYTALTYQTTDP